jgi:MoaA/NifB/PqqE/SkfB family radical SAM enzyme
MKHVSIEIIQKCPNNCMHCSSVSGMDCKELLDVDLVKKVLDGLEEIKVDELSVSGGEPFLHKDLIEIVRYAKDKGFKVNIYTSGIMLNEKDEHISLNTKWLEELSKIKVNKLIFNLQSLKSDVYNKIMCTEGNLNLLKESINYTKKCGIYTELHFVPMKLNYKEIENVVKFVEDNNLDRVSFLGLIPHGRAKVNRDKLYLDEETNLEVKKLLNTLECEKVRVGIPLKLKNEKCICEAGKEKLYIKFDGKVYGCEAFKYIHLHDDNNKEIYPDCIHDNNDIRDIYKNSMYLKAAQKKIKKVLGNIDIIKENCPIQEEIREMK